jgi:hypothetical protein
MIIEQAINMKPAFLVVDGWTMIIRGGQGDGIFKALLGTDNGQGGHHMLRDYRASMPRKSIQAIQVKDDDGGRAMIVYFD